MLQSLGRFRLVGVELRPTAFYRLMHHAADPFTDDITELHDVFPHHAQRLDEHLDPDGPIEQIIAGVEAFLRRQAARALKTSVVDAAVAQIGRNRGLVKIDELAGRAGLSGRQFRRQFATVVGVPPKHYAKIVQINTVIAALMADDTRRLQGLALDHGYYDHAHFVRDFQRFVSLNPSDFLRSGSSFLRTFLGNAGAEASR
ncbi:MAG: helix-turn-helix domain-containing protein [Gammaproteobacteria bacterium]|nr:helix-turn-helix domain-containing protein [Gammaproteobacteria bacterium]